MKKKFILLMLMMVIINLFAIEKNDIKGAKDNPLISRFSGSIIEYYNTVTWDTYILPISKIVSEGGTKVWEKKLK